MEFVFFRYQRTVDVGEQRPQLQAIFEGFLKATSTALDSMYQLILLSLE